MVRTESVEETEKLACIIALNLPRPSVILLKGQVGTGKTAFVRGFAGYFGCRDQVSSPTFTILNEYTAPDTRILHADLYRLRYPEELHEIGFLDALARSDFSLVEWPETGQELFETVTLTLNFEAGASENERVITAIPEINGLL